MISPGPGLTSGGPVSGVAPTNTPIDGGASLLLAGGIGYAVRRLRLRGGKSYHRGASNPGRQPVL